MILADGNMLVALTVDDHVHHDAALSWFEQAEPVLTTCPITEGTLLRFLLRNDVPTMDAVNALDRLRSQSWHRFWADDIPFRGDDLVGVVGHRQVTDAYLAALARHRGGRVITFDRGFHQLHGDVVDLVAT